MTPPDFAPAQRQSRPRQDERADDLDSTGLAWRRYVRLHTSDMRHDTSATQVIGAPRAQALDKAANTVAPPETVFVFSPPRVTQATQVLHRWEGVVIERNDDHFVAEVHELTDRSRPRERAEFSLAGVSREDLGLLVVGGVFYWWIGYRREIDGSTHTLSELRFRRIPRWSRGELGKFKAASDLDVFFDK